MTNLRYLVALIGLLFFIFGFIFDVFFLNNLEIDRNKNVGQIQQNSNVNLRRQMITDLKTEGVIQQQTIYALSTNMTSQFTSKTPVPAVVHSWRQGNLDWHDMIPIHNSKWERFGTPKTEGKLALLVNKEVQVTDYLTQFHESGLAAKYGFDYGPLKAYSGCDIFKSSCMAHEENMCLTNEFCEWDEKATLCIEKRSTSTNMKTCPNPKMLLPDRIEDITDPAKCKNWINDPAILTYIDSESQSMYYHFWSSWNVIVSYWKKDLNSNRKIHFIPTTINDPMFFNYFGLLSDFCWRRGWNQIPDGQCFCDIRRLSASQSLVDEKSAALAVLSYLGLENYYPPKDKVRIGLISRRRKRFILNEYELVDSVRELGYEIDLLPLETMTMYEQMKALRSLDVLIGIHGSALDNSVFLHPGCVLVQLLPYSVEHRVTFEHSAIQAGVIYQEWQLKDKSKAVFHWDLLMQANSEKLKEMTKEQILNQGQVAADSRETLMFWINQDIIVPLEEWIPLVQRAVKASTAKNRGLV